MSGLEFEESSKKRKRTLWSSEEDDVLLETISKNMSWKQISGVLSNKTSKQCYARYYSIKKELKKGRWNDEEDMQIIELVSKYGKIWSIISKIMKNRNGKQIRERYNRLISKSDF